MNKKLIFIVLVAICLGSLVGCASPTTSQTSANTNVVSASSVQESTVNVSSENTTTSSDQETVESAVVESTTGESDEITQVPVSSTNINLSDYENNAVVNITTAGEYTLTGTLTNGQVLINVGDKDKVQLYLNNANITNTSGSAIYVQNAEKVIISLVNGTLNTITDGSSYTNLDEDGKPDAAIFSHDDLTINGSGSLTVSANYSEGIESRDDLKISGGTITVTAVNAGLFGNNSVELKDTVLVISAGEDTIHSDGDILVESGTFTLSSGDDGMHADTTVTINGGTIDILQSYEGIEGTDVIINGGTINVLASDDGINGAGGNSSDSANTANGPMDNFSGSQGSITINGGTITIAAALSGAGDGLDANGTITITGGDTLIKIPSSYRDYSSVDFNTSVSFTGGSVTTVDANGTYTELTASTIATNNMMGGMGGRGGGKHP